MHMHVLEVIEGVPLSHKQVNMVNYVEVCHIPFDTISVTFN